MAAQELLLSEVTAEGPAAFSIVTQPLLYILYIVYQRVPKKTFFLLAKSGLTSGANMLGELKYQILDFHLEN